jgi:malate synthase
VLADSPVSFEPLNDAADALWTPDAQAFVAALVREFRPRVTALLARRAEVQARYDAGARPRFLPETAAIREDLTWRVAETPDELRRRVVEITGPVDRKMIINALNSGADVFMADFEDSSSPTWRTMMHGQVNLRDANLGTIELVDTERGKTYRLDERVATLFVRPRGWHLSERHVQVDGAPCPASLVDFGLYVFHNARLLVEAGSAPYFYLPKLESHLEARLWNDVFNFAQDTLEIPRGSIRATVLIETLPAVFEMDEILYELREHSAGLNCGRWDYIFSYIKTMRASPEHVLPDRADVGMTQPFMRAYTQLLVRTCHTRGAHAMGGMAAQIPIKRDPAANALALEKVRRDKEREATDGHDGTWVAHPGLVGIAREAFASVLRGRDNQLERLREDVEPSADALLTPPQGARTEQGVRQNIRVGIQYVEAWLRGHGCVPLYDLMEDAATAEISRAQLWQWRHHGARLDDGRVVERALITSLIDDELTQLRTTVGGERFDGGAFASARSLFEALVFDDELCPFLTLPGYERLERLNDEPENQ